jgi:hypothetical protein
MSSERFDVVLLVISKTVVWPEEFLARLGSYWFLGETSSVRDSIPNWALAIENGNRALARATPSQRRI